MRRLAFLELMLPMMPAEPQGERRCTHAMHDSSRHLFMVNNAAVVREVALAGASDDTSRAPVPHYRLRVKQKSLFYPSAKG